jgi:hypothetical protein
VKRSALKKGERKRRNEPVSARPRSGLVEVDEDLGVAESSSSCRSERRCRQRSARVIGRRVCPEGGSRRYERGDRVAGVP